MTSCGAGISGSVGVCLIDCMSLYEVVVEKGSMLELLLEYFDGLNTHT